MVSMEIKMVLMTVKFPELTMMRSVEVKIISDFRVKILMIVK